MGMPRDNQALPDPDSLDLPLRHIYVLTSGLPHYRGLAWTGHLAASECLPC